MKRRGKGKQPLGDEGDTKKDPRVLHGDADDGTVIVDVDDDVEFDEPDPVRIGLDSQVPAAYEVLKDIIAERRGGWFAGIARNFRRNTGVLRWTLNVAAGAITGAITGALTGDPVAAIAAAAAGMGAPTLASNAHVRKSRLGALRRDYPDTPEFRDDWAVACYEIMRIIRGFNLRVEAIERLRRMATEVDDARSADAIIDTADAMSSHLNSWREELVEVAELLASYQKDEIGSVLTDPETIATIRIINPLKDGRYDWLILEPELIPPGHERELHERDLREIASHQEAADAMDPYEALRREREKAGEPID